MSNKAANGLVSVGSLPNPETMTTSAIPQPTEMSANNTPEYASFQIAKLLRLDTQAADSEAALASRAKRVFGLDWCYCSGFGWLQWDGKRWLKDARNGARTAANFVKLSAVVRGEIDHLHGLAKRLGKLDRTEDRSAMIRAATRHQRHIKMVESERFAKSAMDLAQADVTVDAKIFQPRPWLLGFENGVWDKGKWRNHRRDDYFLNLSPVLIDEASLTAAREAGPAGSGEWGAVLERITRGDHDYARTLQDVAGNAFSGTGSLRLLCWAYGGGGTGKSTYAELMSTVLGEAAASVDTKLLGVDASRERLGVSIYGKRLAVCAEAGNQRIDAELLKTLSGADRYPICFKYFEPFTADPTHALLMVANNAPAMNAYDDALRERVLALPFTHRLLGDDPENPTRIALSDEGSIEEVRRNPQSRLVYEFAAWALVGMANVLASGDVFRADITIGATRRFWEDTDKLTPFWETVDEIELRAGVTRLLLRGLYEKWCTEEGIRKPISSQTFTQACISAGLTERYVDNKRGWILLGEWQLTRSSYTSDPIFTKVSRAREELIVEGFCENSAGSVGTAAATSMFVDWLKATGPADGPMCRRKLLELGFGPIEADNVLSDLQQSGCIHYAHDVKGFATV